MIHNLWWRLDLTILPTWDPPRYQGILTPLEEGAKSCLINSEIQLCCCGSDGYFQCSEFKLVSWACSRVSWANCVLVPVYQAKTAAKTREHSWATKNSWALVKPEHWLFPNYVTFPPNKTLWDDSWKKGSSVTAPFFLSLMIMMRRVIKAQNRRKWGMFQRSW